MSFIYEKMEHINVFDFTLSAKEMEEIAKLDKAESLFFSHYNPEFVNFLINQSLIAPFHKPGSSNAFSSRPSLLL